MKKSMKLILALSLAGMASAVMATTYTCNSSLKNQIKTCAFKGSSITWQGGLTCPAVTSKTLSAQYQCVYTAQSCGNQCQVTMVYKWNLLSTTGTTHYKNGLPIDGPQGNAGSISGLGNEYQLTKAQLQQLKKALNQVVSTA